VELLRKRSECFGPWGSHSCRSAAPDAVFTTRLNSPLCVDVPPDSSTLQKTGTACCSRPLLGALRASLGDKGGGCAQSGRELAREACGAMAS